VASIAAKSVEGVIGTDDDIVEQTLTVVFEDKKADMVSIKNALKKAGYPIEGEPQYIK